MTVITPIGRYCPSQTRHSYTAIEGLRSMQHLATHYTSKPHLYRISVSGVTVIPNIRYNFLSSQTGHPYTTLQDLHLNAEIRP